MVNKTKLDLQDFELLMVFKMSCKRGERKTISLTVRWKANRIKHLMKFEITGRLQVEFVWIQWRIQIQFESVQLVQKPQRKAHENRQTSKNYVATRY